MNKDQLKKNLHHFLKLRPIPVRWPVGGRQERVDDDWALTSVDARAASLENQRTGHIATLGLDTIHHYDSDPGRDRGELRFGFLSLTVQVLFNSKRLWIEPIPLGERFSLGRRRRTEEA